MKRGTAVCYVLALSGVAAGSSGVRAAELTVVATQPARHALTAPLATRIMIQFDRAVNPATVNSNSFWAFGRWTGTASGGYTFSNANKNVTLTSQRAFTAGDLVTVILANTLAAADGSPMRAAGYSYQFWTRARNAPMSFSLFDTFSNRTNPNDFNRIYGALGADLNRDGWLDLTTVNEVSEDVRVFLNSGDGTGSYDPFLTPFPISFEASPNESADFNRDGKVDMCAAATSTSTVWILTGVGDGTWAPPGQEISVGEAPHGVAVLDVDGDGDQDIATANTNDDNVSLLLNNGSGVMGSHTTFEGGGDREYGIGAGDMDNDGIMDLVVGAQSTEEIIVHRGNGNGTFTSIFTQDAGGAVWMIALGDVNGDGNLDVSTPNGSSSDGSILLGNGAGGLSAPTVQPVASHVVATDLGDVDGDGDLDWMLSAFGESIWKLYENNGAGSFTFDQDFSASSNPSCAILLDIDNDRDLDLALTDEIDDLISLYKNSGTDPLGDFDGDGDVDSADRSQFIACYSGPDAPHAAGCMAGDFDADGDLDCPDWSEFENAWTGPGEPPGFATCAPVIPTIGSWGLLVMILLLACAGSVVLSARRRAAFRCRTAGSCEADTREAGFAR